MKLSRPGGEIFVPDGVPVAEALARTTHMGIVGHPDDLEILAWPAIQACVGRGDRWFCGVVIADGAGSARSGPYAAFSNDEMRDIRVREQRKAAVVGEYGAVALLDYGSADAKSADRGPLVRELTSLLAAARPSIVYTHNLADRHGTHVATALATVEACRALVEGDRPARLLGGEVWRGLDWLSDGDRIAEDVGGRENLAAALIGVFDSQIAGGKRQDLAVLGRRRANATYNASHEVDASSGISFAMDLTPLVRDKGLDPAAYVRGFVDRFGAEVEQRIRRLQKSL